MKRNFQLLSALIFCFFVLFSGKPYAEKDLQPAEFSVNDAVRRFSEAIRAKDSTMLREVVSPNFAVSVVTWPSSWNYLQTLFQHETIDSIVLPEGNKMKSVKGTFKNRVEVLVYVQGKEPQKTYIMLDNRDGKILYMDYFDVRYGLSRNRPSRLVAVLPIEHHDDKDAIIIRLKLNKSNKVLRFLFDSGADGMAISSALAEEIGMKANHAQNTSVVGGDMKISISSGNTVHLDTVQLLNQNIALFDNVREGVDGLIGLNLAKNYIVKVNFDEKKMYLYSFGTHNYDSKGEIEHIAVPRNVIHIPGYLNLTGKDTVQGEFVFDTGAEYFLMAFSPFVRKNRLLLRGFKPEGQSATVSMGISTPVYEGHAKEFGFGQTIKQMNMPVSLQASTGNSKWNPGVDGSVGVKMISRYNFTINLVEKEIHFSLRR